MEASENGAVPREGRGGTDLHRIDAARADELLRGNRFAGGYARLDLMVGTILPRLTGDGDKRR
jgi:hypothetical protein